MLNTRQFNQLKVALEGIGFNSEPKLSPIAHALTAPIISNDDMEDDDGDETTEQAIYRETMAHREDLV